MGLKLDKNGFARPTGYGRISRQELEAVLGLKPGEAIYRSGVDQGVRTGHVVNSNEVNLKPGDTFSAGPRVTKG